FPWPSRFSFRWMSVSFVLRWIVAVRGMVKWFWAPWFRPAPSIRFEWPLAAAAFRIAFQWRSGQSQVRYPCIDRAEGFLVSRAFGREAALTGQNSPRENFL